MIFPQVSRENLRSVPRSHGDNISNNVHEPLKEEPTINWETPRPAHALEKVSRRSAITASETSTLYSLAMPIIIVV